MRIIVINNTERICKLRPLYNLLDCQTVKGGPATITLFDPVSVLRFFFSAHIVRSAAVVACVSLLRAPGGTLTEGCKIRCEAMLNNSCQPPERIDSH